MTDQELRTYVQKEIKDLKKELKELKSEVYLIYAAVGAFKTFLDSLIVSAKEWNDGNTRSH